MKTCGLCVYWSKNDDNHLGGCSSRKFKLGYDIPIVEISVDEVSVEDDEGWRFLTGAKFGCIHWVSK